MELSESCVVMSLPAPPHLPGSAAGLQEEAGLWGSANPHLLGANSGPLLGEPQEAHRQARCELEVGGRVAGFGEPGLWGA